MAKFNMLTTFCVIVLSLIAQSKEVHSDEQPNIANIPNSVLEPDKSNANVPVTQSNATSINKPNKTSSVAERPIHTMSFDDHPEDLEMTTDALIRGFIVFAVLGVAVVVYLAYKTTRANEPPSPDSTVRLYGVVAKRSDVEMRPLPLNEDEDDYDEVLFDRAKMQRGVS